MLTDEYSAFSGSVLWFNAGTNELRLSLLAFAMMTFSEATVILWRWLGPLEPTVDTSVGFVKRDQTFSSRVLNEECHGCKDCPKPKTSDLPEASLHAKFQIIQNLGSQLN